MKKIILILLILISITIASCKKENIDKFDYYQPDELYIDEVLNIDEKYSIENLTPDIFQVDNHKVIPLKSGIGILKINGHEYQYYIKNYNKALYIKPYLDEELLLSNTNYQLKFDYGIDHTNVVLEMASIDSEINYDPATKMINFSRGGKFSMTFYDVNDPSLSGTINFDVKFSDSFEGFCVLFVGNSLTKYSFNIPLMFKNLLDEAKIYNTVIIDAVNSTYLDEHEESFNQLMNKNYYTHVVLQERSNGPAVEYERYDKVITKYNELIQKNLAKLVLYETWGYNYSDQIKKDELRDALFRAITKCASDHNAILVRSGEVFRALENKGFSESLYASAEDINHPSIYGAFASACTFYATLTNNHVSNLKYHPDEISDELSNIIKNTVDNLIFNEG